MNTIASQAISQILRKHKLGENFNFVETKESSATTSWGIEWNEMYIARDIMQNFYDANRDKPESIKVSVEGTTVRISAPEKFNIKKLFYIGSEKTASDVGKYGEGFKAACVCLLRDFGIKPIAVTGNDIYYIHLSDTPVEGTEMYPLIYEYYVSEKAAQGTELILEGCTSELTECLKTGLASFYFRHEHPVVGEYLGSSNKSNIEVYKSKDNQGYIYFENVLRARLGKDIPLVFVIGHAYKSIKSHISYDRDRKTYTGKDADFFWEVMKFNNWTSRNIFIHTKDTLWGVGKGHPVFARCCESSSYYKEIFTDAYFARSTSKDPIENERIKLIEAGWKKEGKIDLPAVFQNFGVKSAKEELDAIKKKSEKEKRNAAQRTPTPLENTAIDFLRSILLLLSPETANMFSKDKTVYYIIETENLLGLFKSTNKYYYREVYLSAKLFTESLAKMLATFVHEHVHIYGHDGSREFTDALTLMLERTIILRNRMDEWNKKWEDLALNIMVIRELYETERNKAALKTLSENPNPVAQLAENINTSYVLTPWASEVSPYFNKKDFIKTQNNGLWGYKSKFEKWLIEPAYEEIENFSDKGTAKVKVNGKWGLINFRGQWLLPPIYDDVDNFCDEEGFIRAKKGGKWGFINRKGEWIIKPGYDFLAGFD